MSLLGLLSPRAWANAKKAKAVVGSDHNLMGDGQTAGGVMVVSGKGVQWAAYETTFGDAPSDEEIVAAARKAVGK